MVFTLRAKTFLTRIKEEDPKHISGIYLVLDLHTRLLSYPSLQGRSIFFVVLVPDLHGPSQVRGPVTSEHFLSHRHDLRTNLDTVSCCGDIDKDLGDIVSWCWTYLRPSSFSSTGVPVRETSEVPSYEGRRRSKTTTTFRNH